MQIVIEIDEEAYNTGQLVHYFGVYSDKLDKVIYDGTPLPKNHGRLIDADKISFEAIKEAEIQIYGNASWRFAGKCEDIINDAHTIIEADTAESEDKE